MLLFAGIGFVDVQHVGQNWTDRFRNVCFHYKFHGLAMLLLVSRVTLKESACVHFAKALLNCYPHSAHASYACVLMSGSVL